LFFFLGRTYLGDTAIAVLTDGSRQPSIGLACVADADAESTPILVNFPVACGGCGPADDAEHDAGVRSALPRLAALSTTINNHIRY
jgi:hypothetical protein